MKKTTEAQKPAHAAKASGPSIALVFNSALTTFVVFGVLIATLSWFRSYSSLPTLETAMRASTAFERSLSESSELFAALKFQTTQSFLSSNARDYARSARRLSELRGEFEVSLQKSNQLAASAFADPKVRAELQQALEDTTYKFETAMTLFRKIGSEYKSRVAYLVQGAPGAKAVTANDLAFESLQRWTKARAPSDVSDAIDSLRLQTIKRIDASRAAILAESRSQVMSLQIAIPFFILLGIGVSILLHRYAVNPVRAVAQACELLVKTGKGKLDPKLPRPKELGGLMDSVTWLMAELRKRDSHLKSILTALEDGVFFFDKDGRFSKEHSLATSRFFPEFSKFKSIYEFYEKHTGTSASAAKQVVTMLWTKDIALRFVDIRDRFSDVAKRVDAQKKEIAEILGLESQNRFLRIPRTKIEAVQEAASQGSLEKVRDLTKGFERFALSDVLAKYPRSILVLGEKLGKYVELKFDSESAEVSYAEARDLDTALLHIFRNCVDHGIEDENTRTKRGKPGEGSIFVRAERSSNGLLRLVVRDDGGGINPAKLAEKAVKNGLWTQARADSASVEEKIDLIFAANLSTRDQVTETSGRGVGMDAVKSHMESLGGSIRVQSKEGEGSSFTLELPPQHGARLALVKAA